MTPSNTELREAILKILDDNYESKAWYIGENTIPELLALFQAREQQAYERGLQTGHDAEAEYQTRTNLPKREQQLLTELLGEAEPVISDDDPDEDICFEAVPVSVIEKYREGL